MHRLHCKQLQRASLAAFLFFSHGSIAQIYVTPSLGLSHFSGGCSSQRIECDKSSSAVGVVLGYQVFPQWAVELGYQHYGTVNAKYPAISSPNHSVDYSAEIQGIEFGLSREFSFTSKLDGSLSAGMSAWFVDMDGRELAYSVERSADGFSPYLGAELGYALSQHLRLKTGIKWISSVGSDQTGKSEIWQPFIGLSYAFGSSSKMSAPSQHQEINVSSSMEHVTNVDAGESANTVQEITIYFEFDNSKLSSVFEKKLKAFVSTVLPSQQISILASTDTLGSKIYNDKLSFKRAMSVRTILLESGLDKSQIEIIALGESHSASAKPATRRFTKVIIHQKEAATSL
ncbi:OmpA family protein [Vibrio caribbeanicus]|uniref:OmpA family protein n=1 Tax=Vibrio caribbeanicus TaxID=701175 RepID=UPI0030DC1F09